MKIEENDLAEFREKHSEFGMKISSLINKKGLINCDLQQQKSHLTKIEDEKKDISEEIKKLTLKLKNKKDASQVYKAGMEVLNEKKLTVQQDLRTMRQKKSNIHSTHHCQRKHYNCIE